jgi:hypothetical protein
MQDYAAYNVKETVLKTYKHLHKTEIACCYATFTATRLNSVKKFRASPVFKNFLFVRGGRRLRAD